MAVVNRDKYASEVRAALVREFERRPKRAFGDDLPTPEEAAQLILDAETVRSDNPMAARIGPVWSGARARQALGLHTRQALSSRRAHGTVLGITTREGSVYYPLFQFRRTRDAVEVHPDLVPVLKALRDVDSWTVAAMLQAEDPELGTSALEWAKSDREQGRLQEWAQDVKHELTAR